MKVFLENYNDWVDLAKSFVGDTYAQDIIQEAYIKLSGYDNEYINRSYIYLTIRSLCFDFLKAKKRVLKVEIKDYNIEDIEENEYKEVYNNLLIEIEKEIETWSWYDREIFKLYRDTPMSLRKLANETGISVTSIYLTIKKCKELLKDKFKQDYEML